MIYWDIPDAGEVHGSHQPIRVGYNGDINVDLMGM